MDVAEIRRGCVTAIFWLFGISDDSNKYWGTSARIEYL